MTRASRGGRLRLERAERATGPLTHGVLFADLARIPPSGLPDSRGRTAGRGGPARPLCGFPSGPTSPISTGPRSRDRSEGQLALSSSRPRSRAGEQGPGASPATRATPTSGPITRHRDDVDSADEANDNGAADAKTTGTSGRLPISDHASRRSPDRDEDTKSCCHEARPESTPDRSRMWINPPGPSQGSFEQSPHVAKELAGASRRGQGQRSAARWIRAALPESDEDPAAWTSARDTDHQGRTRSADVDPSARQQSRGGRPFLVIGLVGVVAIARLAGGSGSGSPSGSSGDSDRPTGSSGAVVVSGSPVASPATASGPTEPRRFQGGRLQPGTYQTATFDPPFRLTLPDDSWSVGAELVEPLRDESVRRRGLSWSA